MRTLRIASAVAFALCLAMPALAEDEKDPTTNPRVKMVTSLGDIVIQLNGDKAPVSTLNFIDYAESDYYDGTIFHRVMPTFMIQGGGFTESIDKKEDGLRPPIVNEWQNGLKNKRGTISMARLGGNPDSATSQFFINVVDNVSLDAPQRDGAAYAVFGKVVEGLDTVDKIKDTETVNHEKYPGGQVVPKTTVLIKDVVLVDKFDRDSVEGNVAKIKADAEAKKQAEEAKVMGPVNDRIAAIEAEHGKKFQTTPSGLKYLELNGGEGETPAPTDQVKVHYVGTFVNGEEFDSSVKRGQPSTFPLNRVIPGWTEGLGMMKPGAKWIFVIPPDLAYGPQGRPGIPPASWLVFEVELLEIL